MHMLSHTYNPSTCAAYSNCYFPNENNITQMKTENICNMLSSSLYSCFFLYSISKIDVAEHIRCSNSIQQHLHNIAFI